MAAKTSGQPAAQLNTHATLVRLIIILSVVLASILLISGGDWGWVQGWVYAVVLAIVIVGGRWWADIRHPGLLAERVGSQDAEDVKPWDRVLSPLMGLSSSILLYLAAGLDHRFAGSPPFSTWLTIVGLVLVVAGWALSTWALVENRFFSGVVRIQTDRGHEVCDTGPYRIVRHPGYAGLILTLPGSVLALASLWAIIPVVLALVIAVLRTSLEDRTLQDELAGYREYAQRTRFRLIPGVY
ncbi:MAG: isoprenylcysteine carboxylmethyltransferase family protein [Anaerolineae bacterium]|nr:isoprenylcysteine carboxylmethyltransferase family protein [Anaerolineae bacterium]